MYEWIVIKSIFIIDITNNDSNSDNDSGYDSNKNNNINNNINNNNDNMIEIENCYFYLNLSKKFYNFKKELMYFLMFLII